MHDVIVIGGGISGMSFAHYCAEAGLETLVLERGERAGGCVQSWRQADGFWAELGAHTCYNSYTALLAILEKRGALDRVRARAKVPFRLLVGDEVRSIGKELHVFELLRSVPRIFGSHKAGKTVREYYGRIVGKRNYDRVFGPLFAAVPSQPADDFPADMMFKKRTRRKDVLRSFTLEGGLSTLIEVMAATPKVTVRTGTTVTGIARSDRGFAVQLAAAGSEPARFVALAAPPDTAASLVREVSPAAAQALARIQVTAIDTLGVVVPRERARIAPFAGIIPLDGRFFSVVSRDTVPDDRHRGFAFHARPGTAEDERLGLASALLGLERTGFEHTTRREVVLPSPRLGHPEIASAVDAAVAPLPLFVTGNYFGGLSLEDCVLRSRAEVERLLKMR